MPSLVSPDVLQDRFKDIYAYASKFVAKRSERGKKPELKVNKNALFLAVKSAYDDIERYKRYHLDESESQKSNCVKRAAYFCKWLCKTQPLEYADSVDDGELGDISGLLANAEFAEFLARVFIAGEEGAHFEFTESYLHELLYDLTFRELHEDALLHIFQNVRTVIVAKVAGIKQDPLYTVF